MEPSVKFWKRSSYCRTDSQGWGDCVEVRFIAADEEPEVEIRCSRYPGFLSFTADEWRTFLVGAKAGEFDLPA